VVDGHFFCFLLVVVVQTNYAPGVAYVSDPALVADVVDDSHRRSGPAERAVELVGLVAVVDHLFVYPDECLFEECPYVCFLVAVVFLEEDSRHVARHVVTDVVSVRPVPVLDSNYAPVFKLRYHKVVLIRALRLEPLPAALVVAQFLCFVLGYLVTFVFNQFVLERTLY